MLKIDLTGLIETIESLNKIKNIYSNPRFIEFLKSKCLATVIRQTDSRLSSIVDAQSAELSDYRKNHKIESKPNGFVLYNDLTKEWTKYSDGKFSIAQAVEYGIGAIGEGTGVNADENSWLYDLKNHGIEGWIYKDESGKTHKTAGYEGRNVYYYTYLEILNQMENWIWEFIESEAI